MANKFIITGTACSGKSSVIDELKDRGYSTLPEVAREVIKQRTHKPITAHEILIRQYEISLLQILQESALEKSIDGEVCFLDRSLIDNLAYCSLHLGFHPDGIEKIARSRDYQRNVFFLDPLPFVCDGVRPENQEIALQIHQALESTYKNLGYNLIRVPVIAGRDIKENISKRTDFILQHCDKLKREVHEERFKESYS